MPVSGSSVLQYRVLLLNGSTWEPLSVITVQRAINLLLAGKAIAVEQTGQYLNTVRTKFEVPSVIALKSYVNVPAASRTGVARACWCVTITPASIAAINWAP